MLRARGIHVEIHGRPILHGVDLELRPGEVTVVIGPNGAGKSTLFSVLSGDIAPSRGSVTLDGRPVAEWKPQAAARERAVMVKDSTVSFPFSVREVVEACRRVTGHPIPAVECERRPGDPPTLVASSAKAKAELGWTPRYDTIDSIVATAWKFHQAHPRGYTPCHH